MLPLVVSAEVVTGFTFRSLLDYNVSHTDEMPPSRSARLLQNAEAALMSAIEIYNKPTFAYREETFAILALNAWELLLKAVRGAIIAFEDDIKIKRALSVAQNSDFYTYKINFKLERK